MKTDQYEVEISRAAFEQYNHDSEYGEDKRMRWTFGLFESYFHAKKQFTQLAQLRLALRQTNGVANFGEFDFRDTGGDTITVVYQPSILEIPRQGLQDRINSRNEGRTSVQLSRPIRRAPDHRCGPMIREIRATYYHPARSQHETLYQPSTDAEAQR